MNKDFSTMLIGVIIASLLAFFITIAGNATYDLMIGSGSDKTWLVFSVFGLSTILLVQMLNTVVDHIDKDEGLPDVNNFKLLLLFTKDSWKYAKWVILLQVLLFILSIYFLLKVLGLNQLLAI